MQSSTKERGEFGSVDMKSKRHNVKNLKGKKRKANEIPKTVALPKSEIARKRKGARNQNEIAIRAEIIRNIKIVKVKMKTIIKTKVKMKNGRIRNLKML